MKLYKKELNTPLGNLIALASQGELFLLDFSDSKGLTAEIKQVINSSKGLLVQGEQSFPSFGGRVILILSGRPTAVFHPSAFDRNRFSKKSMARTSKNPLWQLHFLSRASSKNGAA